jgi:DNA polymerase-3 subunit epsilon
MSETATINWFEYFDRQRANCRDERLFNYYAAETVAPDTPIANAPLVAMDFETTGLDPQRDEIVSVGLVPMSLSRIFCRESLYSVVNPARPFEEDTIIIHGITHSEVAAAPDLEATLDELLAALAGKLVVVHYHPIEREFLDRALLQRLGEGLRFPMIDTMVLERRILAHRRTWLDQLLRRPDPPVRLGHCRERYRLPHYQPHHALTDALATAELLQAQISHHFSPDTPIDQLWC